MKTSTSAREQLRTPIAFWLVFVIAACLLSSESSAQVTWTPIDAAGPAPRHGAGMIYDSNRGVTVLFGGVDGVAFPNKDRFGDTWEWNGARWKKVASSGPSPRDMPAMAYDSKRKKIVLFGGLNRVGFGDTWEWNGKNWRQVASLGPGTRYGATMVYDSAREECVLFAGQRDRNHNWGDTWLWDGKAWTEVASDAGPSPRANAAMVYDGKRDVTVLYGGFAESDTWEWDGTKWSLVNGLGSPGPRAGAGMVYDSRRGAIVLYGGFEWDRLADSGINEWPGTTFSDTWEWYGTKWKQVSASGPLKRWRVAMAYDSARGHIVLFGGLDGVEQELGETWALRSTIAAAYSDYTGDGISDLTVYSPKGQRWNIQGKSNFKWGGPNAIPVPGDYDGNGKADAAFFQASKGMWKAKGVFKVSSFGQHGDLPAPGDYDGDGITDVAFFRPSTGTWHTVRGVELQGAAVASQAGDAYSSALGAEVVQFGQMGDVPVPGDYDGDGKTEMAVYRPSTQTWLIQGQASRRFGKSGAIPVPADYNGNGKTDIAVWLPKKKGQWFIRGKKKKKYGRRGDIPVPGDYDGDGAADIAVYDPVTQMWKVKGQFREAHGKPGELPLAGGQ